MKLNIILAATLAAVASAAPLLSPVALTVGSDGTLVPLPGQHVAAKNTPCHNGKGTGAGLKDWLMSALGQSREPLQGGDLHRFHRPTLSRPAARESWTIVEIVGGQPPAIPADWLKTHADEGHEGAVHGRPGFASVEAAREHHKHAGHRLHRLKKTSVARFNEAMEQLTFAEGLFVSFTCGAGMGALMSILFKITRLLVQRRRARRENNTVEGCGRRSRKCRRAARVAARAAAAQQAAEGSVDEKAVLKQHEEQASLPAYRDVEETPAVADA